jgi:hypothetical protein
MNISIFGFIFYIGILYRIVRRTAPLLSIPYKSWYAYHAGLNDYQAVLNRTVPYPLIHFTTINRVKNWLPGHPRHFDVLTCFVIGLIHDTSTNRTNEYQTVLHRNGFAAYIINRTKAVNFIKGGVQ